MFFCVIVILGDEQMEIKRFRKLKNGMYQLDLGDSKFLLHEDLILKYELLLKKEVSDYEKEFLMQENMKHVALEVALRDIERRLKTRLELSDNLKKKGYSSDVVDFVLLELENRGYLNEEFYTECFIHDKLLFSSDGPLKIENELRLKGISSLIIHSKIGVFTEEEEKVRAEKIVQKLAIKNRASCMSFLKKAKYHLERLGYHDFVVDTILSSVKLDEKKEEELFQKEYQKIYGKLSKKYEGAELEWKVKQKMYQKGFEM